MPFSKKSLTLKIGIVFLLLLLVGLTLFVIATRQRQEFRKKAAYSGSAVLTLTPSKTDAYPGEDVNFLVSLKPGLRGTATVKSTGVEIHVSYDQTKVENVRIQNLSPIFSEIKQNIANGKIDFATGINPVTTPPTFFENPGEVARVNFKVKDAAVVGSKIPFSFYSSDTQDASIVTEYQVDTNVLGAVAPQTLEFNVVQRPVSQTSLNFSLRLYTPLVNRGDQVLQEIVLRKGTTDSYKFQDVQVVSDALGNYSLKSPLGGITPDTYSILIKGPKHLRKNAGSYTLASGSSNLDLKVVGLVQGDTSSPTSSSYNKIDLLDFTRVVQEYGKQISQFPSAVPADVNMNGVVDILDFTLVVQNYNKVGDI